MDSEKEQQGRLEMTFTPNTIEHLGVRMYSTVPPVLAELISNAYDADAQSVMVHLKDAGEKEIIVQDNGHGMTVEEINTKFLRIGRNRRDEETSQESPGGRKVIGKKGLGKLSFFGVAHKIEVKTCKNGRRNTFLLDWDEILNHQEGDDPGAQQNYKPQIIEFDEDCTGEHDGTTITLRSIQRVSEFDVESIADSLSKIFIIDPDFNISVKRNDEDAITIENERKYASLTMDVEWDIPNDIEPDNYLLAKGIRGHLIATAKPISPKTNMRGVTLFSRKKLVNAPEYFSESTSSHFYSYLTGWLEVDFIDDLDDDVIGTNRQSLDWKHPETEELREELKKLMKWLERDWRTKRKEKRQTKIAESTGINVNDWLGKVPPEIESKIRPVIEALVGESELPDEIGSSVVQNVHELIPEYPKLHWRHLHPEVQAAAEEDYKNGDYYRAFQEAAKRYINAVKAKSGSINTSEQSMMGEVFGDASTLSVAGGFQRRDGSDFTDSTIRNVEEGQKLLSMGIVAGARNPVQHEEKLDLYDSGLFSEKDCLDALSLLSHLFRRLDNSAGGVLPSSSSTS